MTKQRAIGFMMMALLVLGSVIQPAMARDYYGYNRYYDQGSFTQRHPYVTKAAIGGGAGAIVGGLLAQEGNRGSGAIKGALVGVGLGAGYQLLKDKGYLNW